MAEQEFIDQLHEYVDNKIEEKLKEFKNDLLFNELGDLQDNLNATEELNKQIEIANGEISSLKKLTASLAAQTLQARQSVVSLEIQVVGSQALEYAQVANTDRRIPARDFSLFASKTRETIAVFINLAFNAQNPEDQMDSFRKNLRTIMDKAGFGDYFTA